MKKNRALKSNEIEILEKQGCTADNWSHVIVDPNFQTHTMRHVHFSGNIKLGSFKKIFTLSNGVVKNSGIYNATIHNCTIGNDVYISQVRNVMANYDIMDEVYIENVDLITVNGETTFGNGIKINVLDETGGRQVPIYDQMSAHLAYFLAMYRHRPEMIRKVNSLIENYANSVRSDRGVLGRSCSLINVRTIKDVHFGECCQVEGAEHLENGSLNSSPEDPIQVGSGVIMKNFIVCSGSSIINSAIVENCFIGQACELGKHYSAEHSLFFANCVGVHGEACSIFAGPYTVTHHKSTLLIAGMFSFLNAGSGSNQSNHMYKLGPIHQGIVERGSKTTSDSYMLWPSKVGPFTLVMGRHYKNSDTSDLPFSYLIESKDESILAPGVNLRSVGTIRDAQKWPRRDHRKDPLKLDFINFKLLSPFTIQKMIRGRDLLIQLKKYSGEKSEFYTFENVKITRSSLERGIQLYNLGIIKFLGNALINRLEKHEFSSDTEVRDRLKPTTDIGTGKWIDIAGLLAPMSAIEDLLDRIEKGTINSLEAVQQSFGDLHREYPEYEWTWAIDTLLNEAGKNIRNLWARDVIQMIEKWKKSVIELDEMLYKDAEKEFTLVSQTGFGIDGDKETQLLDFGQVRGDFEKNPQVSAIREHIVQKSALGDDLIRRMEKLLES